MELPKIALIGYPGSQRIVPASKYLTQKYLPVFHTIYLNYKGDINGWSQYLAGFLDYLTDELVIVALDDYLVSAPIDMDTFLQADAEVGRSIACAKLCQSTVEENREYPVTTQYTLWDRVYLIWLLNQHEIKTPWQFELAGSQRIDKEVIHRPCIEYFTNSCLSSRWEGVRLDGLNQQDEFYVKTLLK